MTRYTFQEIAMRREVTIQCSRCGKPRKRLLKESQTVNPFNKCANGSPKTAANIRSELPARLDAAEARLRKRGIVCRTCERGEDTP